VEVNPRLTTSYLGYRALAGTTLAPWLLRQKHLSEQPPFQGEVQFGVPDL
jgi:predicted ATP-grasp superfamily ATP-dependent carboligase